jgi:drug/metabolite transporter (DMT)-like permease
MDSQRLLLLFAYPCLLGVGQLLFKLSVRNSSSSMLEVLISPLFLFAVAFYGGLTVLWIWILKAVPLSRAYPFVALSFLITPLLGVVVLDEPLGRFFWWGGGLIVAGIVFVVL